jgi:hypothetical protein
MALRANRAGRWTDRAEDVAAWAVLAAGLLLVVCAGVLGVEVHDRTAQQGRTEALGRVPASATLLERAPTIASAYAAGAAVGVQATWEDRSGVTHTGEVTAPQGQEAGSTVPIWVDRSGAAVPEPISAGDALALAVIVAAVVVIAGSTVLGVLWTVLSRVLMACNCAAWEQEWREVAPVWSSGGKRG